MSDLITPRTWRKSSRSNGSGQACVEVGGGGVIGVRDTKDRDGGTLTFTQPAWRAFVDKVKSGQFGL